MRQVCEMVNMPYETLKYYCNEGLIPNVKRGKNNYRLFDEYDVKWINSIKCLKRCNMSIAEMKHYLELCLAGPGNIPERKIILDGKRKELLEKLAEIQRSIDYVDKKQEYYDDVLSGKTKYSNVLLKTDFTSTDEEN